MAIRDYPYWDGGWIVAHAANALLDVAQEFRKTGEACQGKFMLDYIGGFFTEAAVILFRVVQWLLDADKELWFAKERARDLYEEGGLQGLLRAVWSGWTEFSSDPARWVRLLVTNQMSWGSWYANSWDMLIRRVLESFFPTLNDLVNDPRGWVQARIGDFLAGVDAFLRDPITKIVDWLNQKSYWFESFLRDPWGQIMSWADARDHTLWQWLTDPVGRMQAVIENYLKLRHEFWSNPVREGVLWAQATIESYLAAYRHDFIEWADRTLADLVEREYW